MPETARSTPAARWIAPLMLLLGSLCLTLVWVLLSLYLQRQCSWMAVLGALQAALLLRWGGMRPGVARAGLALAATVAMIVLVNWTMAATHIGMAMGLNPFESALKLGGDYAWTLARLANHALDLAWLALAVVIAALYGR